LRADARRSRAAIVDAAIRVLRARADASVEDIAAAAGVSRQTVYAHFGSREGVVGAVLDQATGEVVAELERASAAAGSATDELVALLAAAWAMFERYPLLLDPAVVAGAAGDDAERHGPVATALEALVRRGQQRGEFDAALDPRWIVAATIALGHAAGDRVAAGAATAEEATAVLQDTLLRILRPSPPRTG
jgi:AcrR family transcriptional regulator